MGNWYQSDANLIGDHDRAELAFATATLRTQTRGPLAYSEFQAGWLAGPGDPQPRPADPSNTALALGELAGWGMKGLIDFPLQDTLAPFGWEAPFSNALYAWDAAFSLQLNEQPRFRQTAEMFRAFALYGPALAEAHRVADAAVLYDGRRDAFRAAGSLKSALAACRARGVVCDAVDPAVVTNGALRAFRYVVIPRGTYQAIATRAQRLGVRVVTAVDALPGNARALGTTVLPGPHGTFVVVENRREHWSLDDTHQVVLRAGAVPSDFRSFDETYTLADSAIPLAPQARALVPSITRAAPGVHAYRTDVFEDGAQDVVLQNSRVIAVAVAAGGARVVSFGTYVHDPRDANRVLYENVFDATGALRDDVTVQPPPSTTDRIAKYTHLFPAGTFNRPYSACTFENARGAGAYFAYDAPDVVPSGALFERVVALGASADRLVVDERFTPRGADAAQRLVSLSAIVTGRGPTSGEETFDPAAGGLTIDPPQEAGSGGTGRRVVSVAWRPGDVEAASWTNSRGNRTVRLVLAPNGWRRVTYASAFVETDADAQRFFGDRK